MLPPSPTYENRQAVTPVCFVSRQCRVPLLITSLMPSFCEEDYGSTLYVAEFVNTFSNLAYGVCSPSLPPVSPPFPRRQVPSFLSLRACEIVWCR